MTPFCEVCGETRDLIWRHAPGVYPANGDVWIVFHCADRAGCDARYQAEWALYGRLMSYTYGDE